MTPHVMHDSSHEFYLGDVFESLRNPNYRLFFGGQLISLIGTWTQQVATSWLVYRMTGSAVFLGTITFLGQIPITILSPFAGAFADRHDRRMILYGTQAGAMLLAIILAVLTLGHWVVLWHLFALSILLGVVNAFDTPARQTFISDLVDKKGRHNAIALNTSIFHMSRVIGPAMAGFLVAAVGEGWCFAINALSFLAVLTGIWMMDIHIKISAHVGSAWDSTVEGIRFSYTRPSIRALMVMVATSSFFAVPYIVLMPIIADRTLHGGSGTLGILMGISGVGSVIAALRLASNKQSTNKAFRSIGWYALGFGISIMGFSFATNMVMAGLFLVPAGFFMVSQMVTSNTLIQALVPNRLRGRVMSVFSMMFAGITPFGALLFGHVADHISTAHTLLLQGCITGIAGLIFLSTLKPAK